MYVFSVFVHVTLCFIMHSPAIVITYGTKNVVFVLLAAEQI